MSLRFSSPFPDYNHDTIQESTVQYSRVLCSSTAKGKTHDVIVLERSVLLPSRHRLLEDGDCCCLRVARMLGCDGCCLGAAEEPGGAVV